MYKKTKYTPRERINLLVDKDTFEEIKYSNLYSRQDPRFAPDAESRASVIAGHGQIEGRKVFLYAQDYSVSGGSLSVQDGETICKLMDTALEEGTPAIGLLESGGARIQDGIASLAAYGEIFNRNVLCSGVIPQISVILGVCAGGSAYSAALTDFVFMLEENSRMFVTGPQVIKKATGENVSGEELGGTDTHARISGSCHFLAKNEQECLQLVRELFSYIPSNNKQKPLTVKKINKTCVQSEDLLAIVPHNPQHGYDIKRVIRILVDDGKMLEYQDQFAPNIVTAFARFGGRVAALVASQPAEMAGVIDCDAADKTARFIRFCDCFNIPVVTFVDVPGYKPGKEEEYKGIIRHGAKLLYAYAEASIPKISIILRKAYGGAYIAMGSKSLRGDISYAWQGAEVGVMGAENAVDIIYRKEIEAAGNPVEFRKKKIKDFKNKLFSAAGEDGQKYIDEIIEPAETRQKIIEALAALEDKKETNPAKKHGNMPL
ncbi:MAG: acyl-CoA carboxylase subunit beta [Dehalococcoidales bacterium]|nr:acyl-CoA carboxylase subunit beta [Dehalococcoidales bacterium]